MTADALQGYLLEKVLVLEVTGAMDSKVTSTCRENLALARQEQGEVKAAFRPNDLGCCALNPRNDRHFYKLVNVLNHTSLTRLVLE